MSSMVAMAAIIMDGMVIAVTTAGKASGLVAQLFEQMTHNR